MSNVDISFKNLVISFLVFGFIYTFSYKLQGSQIVHQGQNQTIVKTFFHPYLQGLTFFIGETLCLLVLYVRSGKITNEAYSSKIFIIPAISDLFSVMMQCSALAMISGSTFMMLKGASIITTLLFSHWLIKLEIRSRHVVGCGLAVIGLMIVGLADIYLGHKPVSIISSENQQAVGYTLMVVSLIFNGFLYAYEQKLLNQYQVSPLQMVGWQGIYGTILSFALVLILSFIPCPYTGSKCVYSKEGEAFIEIPSVYLSQVFTNFLLFIFVIGGLVSNAFYNYYGVTITQTMDSLTRSLLNVCRTGLIWLFGIFISILTYGQEDGAYQIESLKLNVNLVKFIGFFSIVLGTLIYNKVVLCNYMKQLDKKWIKEEDLNLVLIQNKLGFQKQVELHQIKDNKT